MSNSEIIDRLSKYILTDGFHIVVNTAKSRGSWIVDVEGKKYLDCYSQFASQPLGWNDASLGDARHWICSVAMHKLANSDMYCKEYATFVEKFAEITPDFEHYFFIDGGALGVENALKAAFDWKLKKTGITASNPKHLDVVHFSNAFHGRTGYTLSLTNTEPVKIDGFPKFDWTRVNTENYRDMEKSMHKNNVAAIIVEPIQGEGGDIRLPRDFFVHLRKMADKYEAMLIFDEVQTGMGLTGKMWAYEHFGIIPDMMCFGKKTQVCGFCATDRIDEVENNVFQTSGRINSTWGGNIVDMVRFCHIIDSIKSNGLVDNAGLVGEYLLSKLSEIEHLSNVRGKGLMIAFDLKSEEERDLTVSKLSENMLVLKCGKNSVRLRPPLTFSIDDAKVAFKHIKEAVIS